MTDYTLLLIFPSLVIGFITGLLINVKTPNKNTNQANRFGGGYQPTIDNIDTSNPPKPSKPVSK